MVKMTQQIWNQIVYTDKDVDVRLTNANKIGLTFFTLTAYNIK